jgi:tRNA(Ile)-lysidine synthase
MARAQVALGRRAQDVARGLMRPGLNGTITLDRDGFVGVEAETQLRISAAALQHVATAPYRPREAALEGAVDRWLAGGQTTLHGCLLIPDGARLIIARELAAAGPPVPVGQVWDARWRADGPDLKGMTQRALGEDGLAQAGGPAGHPRAACLALPAVWQDGRLVACRPLGFGPDHALECRDPQGGFLARLLSD